VRTYLVVLAAAALAGWMAPAASAITAHGHDGPANVDRRDRDRAPVPAAEREARKDLAAELGPTGEVRTQRRSGGVGYVGRRDGLLTEPSTRSPQDVVLDYVRTTPAFGLDRTDMANLRLVARSVSPDGITHLRFNQVLDGVLAFDSGIDGHVTADGRLINVSGAPVPGARLPETDPAVSATAALGEARGAAAGSGVAPGTAGTKGGPARETTFTTGERAVLRWAATADGPRLAWSVITDGAEGEQFDVLVDAGSGEWLRRQGLTHHLGQARFFPGDPDVTPRDGSGFPPQAITMPPSWYDESAGGTRLWGQYARTYVDETDADPAPGAESGPALRQIPASGPGPDWVYAQSFGSGVFAGCPTTAFCTWNGSTRASAITNEAQAATNVHVLTSRFAEHLAESPVGFDEASGNFQRVNTTGEGLGDDYVQAEVNDGQGFDNANFNTPPDGQAPRMQMYLFTARAVNGSDTADIVYHEIAHGLSNRLVVNSSGGSTLSSIQPRMMGEAWSDYYALDLLVHEGARSDTAAAAELAVGAYATGGGGVRAKPTDCPVNAAGVAGCNGHFGTGTVLGGYTYGDLAVTNNVSPHSGGEVWGQTLWDIRSALGRTAANALITGGMRLSVDNPTMLDMRDAILQQAVAMRSAPGSPDDHYAALWTIFQVRGMGASATTTSSASTTPAEAFDAPSGIRTQVPVISDPYPGGDADGLIEPGERFRVAQPVRGIGLVDLPGVTGVLSTGDPAVTIEDATAAWPLLGLGRQAVNADPLVGRMPPSTCAATSPITIDISSGEGSAQATAVIDPRPGSSTVVPIADGPAIEVAAVTYATFTVAGTGAVTDVDLRITELRHSYLGDLRIELIHPDGTVATIIDRLNSGNFAGDDILDAVFDSDVATAPVSTGPGPVTGRVRPAPQAELDKFDGKPASGTWTLRMRDFYPGDSGELRRWGLDSPQVPCGRLEIPEAVTGAASEEAADTATLSGTVTPNGRATGLRFAYGTTPAYGSTTPTQDVGAGDAPQSATAVLTGLAPGTVYHYRV
jgi:subtilisin-like proprotein convertase family protein